MELSINDSDKYKAYFTGNKDAYGQHTPAGKAKKGEKQKGKSWTENKQLMPSNYQKHLQGEVGLGIIPIDSNNNVRFCVIDIDIYPVNFKRYQAIINEFELPFLIFKSKSEGAHIYVFFKEDVKADKAVTAMKKWVSVFGLPESIEVFPKQRRLRTPGAGNWINLPYFGNTRKQLNDAGEEISLSESLVKIAINQVTFEELDAIYNGLPIHDGPPCLQSLYITNDPSMYELYLFNLAVYLKSKSPNNWQEYLLKANERLEDSLDEERVETQVVGAHEKKTYSYRCTEEPICSRCNRNLCETRKHGKGGDEISDFTFEELTQVLSDPPYYKWVVNGVTMTFFSEQELRNQDKFADYSMRSLHKVPNRIKNIKWIAILNKAFTEIVVEKIDQKDDISTGAILTEHVYEFLFERVRAKTREQLAQLGRVFYNENNESLYFKRSELIKYITVTCNYKFFGPAEIQSRLKKHGAMPSTLHINKKIGSIRAWCISEQGAKKLGDSFEIEQELNFEQFIEDKDF